METKSEQAKGSGATGDGAGEALTFAALREANVGRCEAVWHPIDGRTLDEWFTAASGSLGGAAAQIKGLRNGASYDFERFARKLADAVIYIDLLAARAGIELDLAVAERFNAKSEEVGSTFKLPIQPDPDARAAIPVDLASPDSITIPAPPPEHDPPTPAELERDRSRR